MSLGLAVATDIASAALDFHVRGDAHYQTKQARPLLAFLEQGKETFPGGKQYVTEPVQGAFMSDTAGFFVGYTEDAPLSFAQAANLLRAQVPWKECHAGFIITFTELKKDGISVVDGEQRTTDHSQVELTRLTAILKNRLNDFSESWARSVNNMLWADGSQDTSQIPGVKSLILDDPTAAAQTIASLSTTTYTWWRNRAKLDLAFSAENQTLSKFLRNEVIQLTRFGGRPNKALCGSAFWDALMQEVEKKGIYTQQGFKGGTDIGINRISITGIGTFEYDPSLDSQGRSKYCYVFDSRRIRLRPMEMEEDKTLEPARPYQYMVLVKSMTYTGALEITQPNACAVYAIS